MSFVELYEASLKNELILIEGGICNWHLRKDGQLTIREIISIKPGAGKKMMDILKQKKCLSLVAKCPANLESNKWYEKQGFELIAVEKTRKTNKPINVWQYKMNTLKNKGMDLK